MKTGYWTIERLESLGLKKLVSFDLWCSFRGYGFDIYINLDVDKVKGNLFNFKSCKNSMKGNFKAVLETEEEFKELMRLIC